MILYTTYTTINYIIIVRIIIMLQELSETISFPMLDVSGLGGSRVEIHHHPSLRS